MLIFLGAGASKSFGIPTMIDFVKKFDKWLIKNAEEEEITTYEKIREILGGLKDIGYYPDLELLMSILKDLSDIKNFKKRRVPSDLIYDRIINDIDFFSKGTITVDFEELKQREKKLTEKEEIFKNLLINLKKFVLQKCLAFDSNKIYTIYDKFFNTILSADTVKFFDGSSQKISGMYSFYKPRYGTISFPECNVFTTNYDVCFEMYCEERGIFLTDGFKSDPLLRKVILDPSSYQLGLKSNNIQLFKLHGSIDMDVLERGNRRYITRALNIADYDTTIYGEKKVDKLMIYPVEEKYLYNRPFFEMFYHMQHDLSIARICICVGHSFRDEVIKNLFIDSIRGRKNIKMFLIDPQADSIVAKLGPIKNNIMIIKGNFEDNLTLTKLKDNIKDFYPQ